MALSPDVPVKAPGELITAAHLNAIRSNLDRIDNEVTVVEAAVAAAANEAAALGLWYQHESAGSNQNATGSTWVTITGSTSTAPHVSFYANRLYNVRASALLDADATTYPALAVRLLTSGVDLFHTRVSWSSGQATVDTLWTPSVDMTVEVSAVFNSYYPTSAVTVTHRADVQPCLIAIYDVGPG